MMEDSPAEFICFCDTSKLAYRFSLYAKQGTQCFLLLAKAKATPIKRKTLPTLELVAIYLVLKVVPNTLKTINILSIFFVFNAQMALSWVLNGKRTKRSIFVENRDHVPDIKKMLEDINLEIKIFLQFKYVPSSKKSVDLLTRGLSTSKFEQSYNFGVHSFDLLNQLTIDWPMSPLPCLNDANKKIYPVCSLIIPVPTRTNYQ